MQAGSDLSGGLGCAVTLTLEFGPQVWNNDKPLDETKD